MIVTCPACETRYLIDPRALGAAGRTVRCTQCDQVWMQAPAEDAPRRVDLPLPSMAAAVAVAPARAISLPPLPPRAPVAPSPVMAEIPVPAMVAAPAMTAIPPRPAVAATDDLAFPDRPGDTARGGARPILFLLILVIVLGGLWFGRDAIVDAVPALGGVYAALGLGEGGDPRTDLEFRQVTSDREIKNGQATLVITGEVANISENTRHVPPLRITLEDAARHAIKSWIVVATSDRLRPGATVAFRSSVTDPGEKTVGASVSFDNGTD